MSLGIIVRADKTGLGNQTRNLVKMLKPDRLLIIDSTPFNGNAQYFDTYAGYDSIISNGFPDDATIRKFLYKLDAVLTCETFYSKSFIPLANRMGVRTYNQFNYEFLDHLINKSMPLPTLLLSPSYWHLNELKNEFYGKVEYLPPPIDTEQFTEAQLENTSLTRKGKRRLLHVVGRQAVNDRNGTLDLFKALEYTKSNFELVIKVQTNASIPRIADPRVTFDYSAPDNEAELYKGFDAMILPRRYAGLCLPMIEAMQSGLPVIMTNVDPNNRVLPIEWLVSSTKVGEFKTRTTIPLYSADPVALAARIDWIVAQDRLDLGVEQQKAIDIVAENYTFSALRDKYKEILR